VRTVTARAHFKQEDGQEIDDDDAARIFHERAVMRDSRTNQHHVARPPLHLFQADELIAPALEDQIEFAIGMPFRKRHGRLRQTSASRDATIHDPQGMDQVERMTDFANLAKPFRAAGKLKDGLGFLCHVQRPYQRCFRIEASHGTRSGS